MTTDMNNAFGWDDAEALAKETSKGGTIFKLENDGDRALVVFSQSKEKGEFVYAYQSLFLNDENKSLDISTKEGKQHLKENPDDNKNVRFRARVGLLVLAIGNDEETNLADEFRNAMSNGSASLGTDGGFWEVSKTVFTDLKKRNGRKPFNRFVYEIERNGASGDKKTNYFISCEYEIDDIPGLREHLDRVSWKNLQNPFEDQDDDGGKPGKRSKSDEGKGKADAGKTSRKPGKLNTEERARIKEMFQPHRGLVAAVCEHLGIASFKDMTSDMVEKAEVWLKKETGTAEKPDDDFFDD